MLIEVAGHICGDLESRQYESSKLIHYKLNDKNNYPSVYRFRYLQSTIRKLQTIGTVHSESSLNPLFKKNQKRVTTSFHMCRYLRIFFTSSSTHVLHTCTRPEHEISSPAGKVRLHGAKLKEKEPCIISFRIEDHDI